MLQPFPSSYIVARTECIVNSRCQALNAGVPTTALANDGCIVSLIPLPGGVTYWATTSSFVGLKQTRARSQTSMQSGRNKVQLSQYRHGCWQRLVVGQEVGGPRCSATMPYDETKINPM